MLAFHMMNQGPRDTIFPRTLARGIGTLLMFVVRNIFSRADALRDTMGSWYEGRTAGGAAARVDPLGFLIHEGGASSLTDAAYRFARHEPGADVVLFAREISIICVATSIPAETAAAGKRLRSPAQPVWPFAGGWTRVPRADNHRHPAAVV